MMILFLLPFLCGLLAILFPNRYFASVLSLIPLAYLAFSYPLGEEVKEDWLPAVSIQFYLKVDALSLLFLFLTAVIVPVSLATAPKSRLFYGLAFGLEGLLFGFFTARDLAIFTLFWEAMLIPLYFMITLWGTAGRAKAALKFILYMIAGSALMVAAVLALYFASGATFNLDSLAKAGGADWIFAIFLLAFAVKTPLFPFHGWLPDAYCQASTSGTILLSAILSKAGVYGILRIGMEIFPVQLKMWSPPLLGLAIAGVLYGAFAAWQQMDFKRLIAYSSLSHINFVLAGLFIWAPPAQPGAILQALNHGVTIAALFLMAGWLEQRIGTTRIGSVSGLCKFLPQLCWWTLFFVLSSVALPGTNNFIGELMILLGLFKENPWQAALLALSVVLSVVYMLRWMQKVYFEEPIRFQESWIDMRKRETVLVLPLAALILWIGIYPAPLLDLIKEFSYA